MSAGSRRIIINGEAVETHAATLHDLLGERGYAPNLKIATAVNGAFVPARARSATPLHQGDHIEVVSARQGG